MSTTTLEMNEIFSRNNHVSKLDRLNARVGKLLTAAVHEVLEVVRETVLEYQEKTARTHRENERLRNKLREALEKLEKERELSRVASISLTVNPLSTQSKHVPEAAEVSSLNQGSTSLWNEDPSVKKEDGLPEPGQNAEPETVCDLRVALTLADKCPIETEGESRTDSDSLEKQTQYGPQKSDCGSNLAVEDIKTEPVALECSSALPQNAQVGFVTTEGSSNTTARNEEPVVTNHYAGFGTYGRRVRLALEGRRHQHHPPGLENHVCHVCGKIFSRVGNLRIHQRCHTGERPHRCMVCGRSFRQAGDLNKHKRVHTGEKPYCCVQCGKSFNRGENLRRHQKIHEGGRLHRQQPWRDFQGSNT